MCVCVSVFLSLCILYDAAWCVGRTEKKIYFCDGSGKQEKTRRRCHLLAQTLAVKMQSSLMPIDDDHATTFFLHAFDFWLSTFGEPYFFRPLTSPCVFSTGETLLWIRWANQIDKTFDFRIEKRKRQRIEKQWQISS